MHRPAPRDDSGCWRERASPRLAAAWRRTPIATPTRHSLDMAIPTTPSFQPRRRLVAGAIVEEWWCPVCDRAAHRIHRPGRPRIYCSNACRQRAYRYRRAHGLRTTAHRRPAVRVGVRARGNRQAPRTARPGRLHVEPVRRPPQAGDGVRRTRHADALHASYATSTSCSTAPVRADPASSSSSRPARPIPPIAPPDWTIASQRRHTATFPAHPHPSTNDGPRHASTTDAGQVPVHSGGRFSANAFGPSLASFDVNTLR